MSGKPAPLFAMESSFPRVTALRRRKGDVKATSLLEPRSRLIYRTKFYYRSNPSSGARKFDDLTCSSADIFEDFRSSQPLDRPIRVNSVDHLVFAVFFIVPALRTHPSKAFWSCRGYVKATRNPVAPIVIGTDGAGLDPNSCWNETRALLARIHPFEPLGCRTIDSETSPPSEFCL